MTMNLLNIRQFTRVEGHGGITVRVEDGAVASVELKVTEAARVFEDMTRGRSYEDVALLSSRVCGICSSSHTVTSLYATEAAFGIEVSERTRLLRRLLIQSSFLQNHATHLFLFAAPDYLGIPSALPLAQTAPELLGKALRVKQLGNEVSSAVGGRSVHPMTAVIGGFVKEPTADEFRELARQLEAVIPVCEELVDFIGALSVPDFQTEGDFLAMKATGRYALDSADVAALLVPWTREVGAYTSYIDEQAVSYSNALLSRLADGRTYMTGALARLNHSWGDLTSHARVSAAKVALRPVCLNPYRNNVSQAIELVDVAERCAQLCGLLAEGEGDSTPVAFSPCEGLGVAATEAPRGTLYHSISYDAEGRVVSADILTPTAQNLANLEADVRNIAPRLLEGGEEALRTGVEKLVRAYDPCLSCAVH